MHRSSTSLVASVLQRAGLDIGREISGPGLGNPRGHFEDQDFFRLHEDMLAAAGESCFTAGDDFSPSALPEIADFERRARRLVAERTAIPLWGWKDPRTCLFLDFWDPLLPDARYFFLYRHPVDVALSLWRRNSDRELRQDPGLAIRAWEVYNRRLLEFSERNAERCFVAQVPALTADLSALVRRLRAKLGLALQDGCASTLFVQEELTPQSVSSQPWEELIPGALALYQRLEERADLPAREANALTDRQPLREHELLGTNEVLLFALLERDGHLRMQKERFAAQVEELEAALAREQEARKNLAAELEMELERRRTQEEAFAAQVGGLEAAFAREQEARENLAAELKMELERRRTQEEAFAAQVGELEGALAREQEARENLQAELELERRRTKELAAALDESAKPAQVLAEIEGSRSFALVRAWWWLRRRLKKQELA